MRPFYSLVWPFCGLSWLYIAFSRGHRSKFICSLQIYFFSSKWILVNKKWVDLQAISLVHSSKGLLLPSFLGEKENKNNCIVSNFYNVLKLKLLRKQLFFFSPSTSKWIKLKSNWKGSFMNYDLWVLLLPKLRPSFSSSTCQRSKSVWKRLEKSRIYRSKPACKKSSPNSNHCTVVEGAEKNILRPHIIQHTIWDMAYFLFSRIYKKYQKIVMLCHVF